MTLIRSPSVGHSPKDLVQIAPKPAIFRMTRLLNARPLACTSQTMAAAIVKIVHSPMFVLGHGKVSVATLPC